MVEISASLPPLIGRVLENLDAYRAGTLTILELAENLFATASAVEGDVPADLRVKIAKNWQRDPKQLGRLGF